MRTLSLFRPVPTSQSTALDEVRRTIMQEIHAIRAQVPMMRLNDE